MYFNCLRSRHMVKKCPSTHNCKPCGNWHQLLLYMENQRTEQSITTERKTANNSPTSGKNLCLVSGATERDRTALLGFNYHRQENICRALIDNGSQLSFVGERFVGRHGLPPKPVSQTVKPVGAPPPIGDDESSCADNFVIAWRRHSTSILLHDAPSHIRFTRRRFGCTRT